MLSLSFIKEIEKIIGRENVLTGEADRQNYAYDAAVLPPVVPGLVVRPTRTDQLGPLIQKCYEEGIPITIRGSGTNLSGGTIPDSTDAVIILTNSLDRILEINEEEMYAVVEPGVITCDLAAAVAARGLFYPPDPGSMSVSTMGGNIAENSGGLRGLKYGTTKKYVMGLEVLTERMKELGLNEEDYWWYLDLRKYGGVKHSGYGLGFERIIMYITGMSNIRDVLPFPRTPKTAEF